MPRKDGLEWAAGIEPGPSAVAGDPLLEIWVRIIYQALKDLTSPDPALALDALVWLTYEPAVTRTLDLIGIPDVDPLAGIGRILDHEKHAVSV